MPEVNLHLGAGKELFAFSRKNRKKATLAEYLLWQQLRNRKLEGLKFRRQHPLGHFITDFYCYEIKLVVELDGEYHTGNEQAEYDSGRTYKLNALGIQVLRFTNEEVINDLKQVLQKIKIHLTLNPSPKGEGL